MTSPQWFVVERITGERKNDDGETTHFRVKWANYPDAESTWEPAARVKRAGWAARQPSWLAPGSACSCSVQIC